MASTTPDIVFYNSSTSTNPDSYNITYSPQSSSGYHPQSGYYPQSSSGSDPLDGYIAKINDKLFRYNAISKEWHEVVEASTEIAQAPKLPIVLDAKDMLEALKNYQKFLQEVVDELDDPQRDAVEHTLFGLREAIEGLEKV